MGLKEDMLSPPPGGTAEAVAAAPVPVRSQRQRAQPGPARAASAPHVQGCALPLTAVRGVRAPCSRQKVDSRFHQILSCGKSYSWWGWVPKALVLKVCSLDHKSGIAYEPLFRRTKWKPTIRQGGRLALRREGFGLWGPQVSLPSSTAMSTLVISVLCPGLYSERTESLIPIAVFRIAVWETDLGNSQRVSQGRKRVGGLQGQKPTVVSCLERPVIDKPQARKSLSFGSHILG